MQKLYINNAIGLTIEYLHTREEESHFHSSRFRSVRSVYGIGVDAVCKVSTNGALLCFLRISSAHQVTVLCNRALTLQHLNHHWTGNHEAHEVFEERTLFMY